MDIQNFTLVDLLLLLELKKLQLPIHEDFVNSCNYDEVYTKVSEYYNADTGKHIDILDEKNKNILYDFAKKKSRYELLNNLLVMFVNNLSKRKDESGKLVNITDPFIMNSLDVLLEIIKQQSLNLSSFSCPETYEFSKLDKNETENLIVEFLTIIDPTLEWLNIYQTAKQDGKFIYLNEYTKEELSFLSTKFNVDLEIKKNFCTVLGDGSPWVFLEYVGNLNDVVTTIHEFIHYITFLRTDYVKLQFSLSEFPSIFYESFCLLFLEDKGYSKDELSVISLFKTSAFVEYSYMALSIFSYIKLFLDNNCMVTEDVDLEKTKNMFTQVEKYMTEERRRELSLNFRALTYDLCDSCIANLLIATEDNTSVYSYLLGKYLTDFAINSLKNDRNILSDIKSFTEDLSVDPIEVFKSVGCDVEKLGLVSATEGDKSGQKVYGLLTVSETSSGYVL